MANFVYIFFTYKQISQSEHYRKPRMEKKFSCDICERKFSRKHNLKSHAMIHTDKKPFQCTKCDASFRRFHDLRRHEKLHSGEKPFACDTCGRSFARHDAMIRHKNSSSGCSNGIVVSKRDSDGKELQPREEHARAQTEQAEQPQADPQGEQAGGVSLKPLLNEESNIDSSLGKSKEAQPESSAKAHKAVTAAQQSKLLEYVKRLESQVLKLGGQLPPAQAGTASLAE